MTENENVRLLRDLKIKSKYLMNTINALQIELRELGLLKRAINDIFVNAKISFLILIIKD